MKNAYYRASAEMLQYIAHLGPYNRELGINLELIIIYQEYHTILREFTCTLCTCLG